MRSTLITLGTAWCTHRKGTGRPSDTNALSFINHSWPRDKSSFLVFLLYSCSSIFLFVRLHAGRCIGRRRYLDSPCRPSTIKEYTTVVGLFNKLKSIIHIARRGLHALESYTFSSRFIISYQTFSMEYKLSLLFFFIQDKQEVNKENELSFNGETSSLIFTSCVLRVSKSLLFFHSVSD